MADEQEVRGDGTGEALPPIDEAAGEQEATETGKVAEGATE
jgi:hypothetical protein